MLDYRQVCRTIPAIALIFAVATGATDLNDPGAVRKDEEHFAFRVSDCTTGNGIYDDGTQNQLLRRLRDLLGPTKAQIEAWCEFEELVRNAPNEVFYVPPIEHLRAASLENRIRAIIAINPHSDFLRQLLSSINNLSLVFTKTQMDILDKNIFAVSR